VFSNSNKFYITEHSKTFYTLLYHILTDFQLENATSLTLVLLTASKTK